MKENKYNALFQTYKLNNGVEIKNRLAVAPMTHFASNADGSLSDDERAFLQHRAENMGMFITAATLVMPGGKAFFGQPTAYGAKAAESLKATADLIKRQGAKAILQLHFGGNKALADLNEGHDVLSPSGDEQSREITVQEIEQLIAAFGNATTAAIKAGFDGVEIHGANGYMLQQFYSAQTNQRTDEWGGSLEKRMRFPLAVVDAVTRARTESGNEQFIIGYRFSPEEPGEDGLTMKETLALVDQLLQKPLQYLHVSLHDFYAHNRRGADTSVTRLQTLHSHIDGKLPLMGVGKLFSGEDILKAYEQGWAEFIALGKTVMINPTIATLLKEDKEEDIVTVLDPEKEDHYAIPPALWSMCVQGGSWLPPVKGKEWQPVDI